MMLQRKIAIHRTTARPCFVRNLTALAILLALIAVQGAVGQMPFRECWTVPESRCNNPIGDCINKAPGTWCNHCNVPSWISATCVWHPSKECTPDSSQSIDCGDKLRGFCDEMGWCNGNTLVGDCILFPCGQPT